MSDKVLMKGNEAIAEAAIRCGCRHYFGYPITPQTEIAAYMAQKMPTLGGTLLQAESEIAATHRGYGAAATGARAASVSGGPFAGVRAASGLADGTAAASFEQFEQHAADVSAAAVLQALALLD